MSDLADRELRVHTACLMVLATVAGAAALYWLRPVLLPFVLAVFLVAGLGPILDVIQERLRAPRLVAVAVAFVLGLLLLALLWLLIWLSVASLLENAGVYRERFRELAERTAEWLPTREVTAADAGAAKVDAADVAPPSAAPTPDDAASRRSPEQAFGDFVNRHFNQWMGQLSSALMDLLSYATIVLIFMFFLLLGESGKATVRLGMWTEIEARIRSYIVTKSVISLVTGVAFGLVLWLFGVPLAFVFGILAFLLNFIPNVGPIIASLLPLPLILLDPHLSPAAMIVVIALASGVQFISGNIVEPKIMGESFELHPIAILLTLMFWGMIWGIVGMFVATPITAAVVILLDKFDHTRPIARLLAGRLDGLGSFSAHRK